MPDYYDEEKEKIINLAQKIPKLKFSKTLLTIILAILIVAYLSTGIFVVAPDEQGVIRRFGKFVRIESPGLNYHLPYPLETVVTPAVTQVKRIEIGFRSIVTGQITRYQEIPDEALMLTGDENIVSADAIVQYKIKDPVSYLFNIILPEETVRNAAEASLRQVIGGRKIDDALTVGKYEIQEETKKLLQDLLDSYKSGIFVVAVQLQDVNPPKEVQEAFKDVASAKEDKSKYINQAQGYENDLIPKARGEAVQMTKEAEGYKIERIKKAEGDVAKFNNILTEYKKGEYITQARLYLETMEEILPNMNKVIVDLKENQSLINLLPLGDSSILTAPSQEVTK
ncbi:MAG: HflK protein [Actinobacteria bacterium RBG_13_35_12]|uniref:Protein HflK n=1 Tax=Candidatus Sediminicultor quintus TaxID=1797291 RepID=A0A1F5AB66_9BACT|nr:MAG: HflK protein [Actinobacteria bacterium RBG_13_35_12]OGD15769.1 MAG: HflK protein [Candidatus Atribacteria bacterium RBG_19FT_COMBO_35_14]OGD35323.1 MAG: HflK protein [Candidatus Atribacteria bacterium RBG_16_35_8]